MWNKSLAYTDCYFYENYYGHGESYSQCSLAESYECPCDIEYNDRYDDDEQKRYDCDSYISKKDANKVIKSFINKRREKWEQLKLK